MSPQEREIAEYTRSDAAPRDGIGEEGEPAELVERRPVVHQRPPVGTAAVVAAGCRDRPSDWR